MATNFFFSILKAYGIVNYDVAYTCAIAFYGILYLLCAAIVSTYTLKEILRRIESLALLVCRGILEIIIFFCILLRYNKRYFFKRYKKRRNCVLTKLARR